MLELFTTLDRRSLLRGLGKAALAGTAGLALARGFAGAAQAATRWDRTLVLLHLDGGNDGLNTVVPYTDPAYAKLRPSIGLSTSTLLQLGNNLAFHPALAPLMGPWAGGAGDLALMLGLGYPSPDFSHFRSGAIWETGSSADQVLVDGWAGRLIAGSPPPATLPADAVITAGDASAPFESNGVRLIELPSGAHLSVNGIEPVGDATRVFNPALNAILGVQQTVANAATAFAKVGKTGLPVTFPTSSVGAGLQQVAAVMATQGTLPGFALLDGGYDTHTDQRNRQNVKLGDLAAALVAFRNCLIKLGLWDRTLVMTYAEFGRRANENGSAGTDHGTANVHFVMGGQVRGGFYGSQPSLGNLVGGNLVYSTDFRQLYSTIARGWWGIPEATIGAAFKSFPSLPFLQSPAAV